MCYVKSWRVILNNDLFRQNGPFQTIFHEKQRYILSRRKEINNVCVYVYIYVYVCVRVRVYIVENEITLHITRANFNQWIHRQNDVE